MTETKQKSDTQAKVQKYYEKIAANFEQSQSEGCCCSSSSGACCGTEDLFKLVIGKKHYTDSQMADLPAEITNISLGCGDPLALADLTEGQTVLDLGSGGGLDCFLAAGRVGPTGHVIGVDMTAAMIARARENQEKISADNVEFRLGKIEDLPVPDETVDVILSNCVINLSPDKTSVFKEAFRVLQPGGKLAISDIVADGELPDAIKNDPAAWSSCIAGAVDFRELVGIIEEAGFTDVQVRAINSSDEGNAQSPHSKTSFAAEPPKKWHSKNLELELQPNHIKNPVFSAKITAKKPDLSSKKLNKNFYDD